MWRSLSDMSLCNPVENARHTNLNGAPRLQVTMPHLRPTPCCQQIPAVRVFNLGTPTKSKKIFSPFDEQDDNGALSRRSLSTQLKGAAQNSKLGAMERNNEWARARARAPEREKERERGGWSVRERKREGLWKILIMYIKSISLRLLPGSF